MDPLLRDKLEELRDLAKAKGVNFIGALAAYSKREDANFSTAVSLFCLPQATKEHAMLDLMREIMVCWSNGEHESQLMFVE